MTQSHERAYTHTFVQERFMELCTHLDLRGTVRLRPVRADAIIYITREKLARFFLRVLTIT